MLSAKSAYNGAPTDQIWILWQQIATKCRFFACYGAYGYVAFITTKLCNQAVRKLCRHITRSATLLIRFLDTARFHTVRLPDIADNPRHLSPSALQHN